jgi:D-alanyl-D-alanine dipeptidase
LKTLLIILLVFVFIPGARARLDLTGGDPGQLVDLKTVDASIRISLPYSTPFNFTKKAVYEIEKCVLRRSVAQALRRVQSALRLNSVGLKVYDCYRPLSAQKIFWSVLPDERYVANPEKGSTHNRGSAVDLTLVDRAGIELDMPSAFAEFSAAASRRNPRISPRVRRNLSLLESAMKAEGFIPRPSEWWHFDFKGTSEFPLEDTPLSKI